MKLISVVLFFPIVLSAQILVKPTDTLIINKKVLTNQSLWIQTQSSEIRQRFNLEQYSKKLKASRDIFSKLDSIHYLQISQKDSIIYDYRKLNLLANKTVERSYKQLDSLNIKQLDLNNYISKEKNRKAFWRTTSISLLITTVISIILR